MSWVTIIWSMSAAVSLTLGAIHVVVWFQNRKAGANLVCSITALAVAGMAACEMMLMHAGSVERFGAVMRRAHVPLFVQAAGIVGFVGLYFGTARWWLGGAAVGLRLLSLILNRFLEAVHPDDRATLREAVQRCPDGDGAFRSEYRGLLPGGAVRWIAGRGEVESNTSHAMPNAACPCRTG
jgi:hypothetical protein